MLVELLTRYGSVLSIVDGDVDRNTLVENNISLANRARSVCQPPHHWGPEKEVEREREVVHLLQKRLIEPPQWCLKPSVELVKKSKENGGFTLTTDGSMLHPYRMPTLCLG